jgi:hypothetical protein
VETETFSRIQGSIARAGADAIARRLVRRVRELVQASEPEGAALLDDGLSLDPLAASAWTALHGRAAAWFDARCAAGAPFETLIAVQQALGTLDARAVSRETGIPAAIESAAVVFSIQCSGVDDEALRAQWEADTAHALEAPAATG